MDMDIVTTYSSLNNSKSNKNLYFYNCFIMCIFDGKMRLSFTKIIHCFTIVAFF